MVWADVLLEQVVYGRQILQCEGCGDLIVVKDTRCSAIAERPRCSVRYSFRQK